MDKLEEAREILEALGLPVKQQKKLAARILMALADVGSSGKWSDAKARDIGIHAMIQFIATHGGKTYAENTRETFRKTVLRPLELARVVDKNRDDPGRPTNSKHNQYALTRDALVVVRAHGTAALQARAAAFKKRHGALLELYMAARKHHQVPVKLPSGQVVALSPGKHNALEKAILEEFAPRFAPGALLVYLGDTAKKDIVLDKSALEEVGVHYSVHDKFPDIILYLKEKGWLLMIEAVTSHGPISPGRLAEMQRMLANCKLCPVFVTAFPDFKTFKRFADDVAWETEVWIRELPSHMIHYNGDKFFGPASKAAGAGEL